MKGGYDKLGPHSQNFVVFGVCLHDKRGWDQDVVIDSIESSGKFQLTRPPMSRVTLNHVCVNVNGVRHERHVGEAKSGALFVLVAYREAENGQQQERCREFISCVEVESSLLPIPIELKTGDGCMESALVNHASRDRTNVARRRHPGPLQLPPPQISPDIPTC